MFTFADLSDPIPESFFQPMMWPLILSAIGFALFALIKHYEARMKWPAAAKWGGLAPAVIGLFLGFGPFRAIRDEFYYQSIKPLGDKMIWAHWLALLLPLFAILAAVAWVLLDRFAPEEYVEVIEQP